MPFHFSNQLPHLSHIWEKYAQLQERLVVPAKTILLSEGQVSKQYIFIEQGCIRIYINSKDDENTLQFFFENEGLSAIESFINNSPSQYAIETIEPCIIHVLHVRHFMQLLDELARQPDFTRLVIQLMVRRQTHYFNEFASFIRDTPQQRYQKLLDEKPEIVQRVAHRYIASYVGVSAVHLSRIKQKLARGKDHF